MLSRLAALLALIALSAPAQAADHALEALDPETARAEIAESEGVVLVDLWADY